MEFSKIGINETAIIRVIRTKDNGGAIIEMAIATQTFDVHSSRTAGGGKQVFDVSVGVLDEMVHNFGKLPGPVAVYVGHIPEEMKQFTPAVGYIESLRRDGTSLYATIDLTPDGAFILLRQEGFRSASMEFGKNVQTVNSEIAGWSLTGLALTNDPALAIVNKIAAGIAPLATIHTSQGQHYAVRLSLAKTTESNEESHMLTDKQIADLQADLAAKETQLTVANAEIAKLTAEVEAGKAEIVKLSASDSDSQDVIRNRSREYSKLAIEVETLKQSNQELMGKMNSRDVIDIIENALEQGKVTPAEVAGYADNTMKWLSTNYGEAFTPAQLEMLFSKRAVVVNTKDRKSSGSFSQNLSGNLSRELQDGLRKMGLDPALASCHSAADAQRIADSKKGK